MTQTLISTPARRKRTANLLSRAREQRPRELSSRERESRWRIEHADFITAHNAVVAQEGLPLECWKTF